MPQTAGGQAGPSQPAAGRFSQQQSAQLSVGFWPPKNARSSSSADRDQCAHTTLAPGLTHADERRGMGLESQCHCLSVDRAKPATRDNRSKRPKRKRPMNANLIHGRCGRKPSTTLFHRAATAKSLAKVNENLDRSTGPGRPVGKAVVLCAGGDSCARS